MKDIKIQTRDGPVTVNIPWKIILIVVVVGLFLVIVKSSYYSVEAGERGVIQRFGEYSRISGPGLHFKLPWGIEKVTKVNVELRYKQEFGYRTMSAGVQSRYDTWRRVQYEQVSLMLTGDLNCAVVEWSVQYNIKDPVEFLFNVRNPETTLHDMCESIMREIVGDRSVTEVLTMGREEINFEVKQQLQEVLDQYKSGINITQVICQNVLPPREVKTSFDDVNKAQQEMDKIVQQARAEYNKIIPRAEGQALKTINEAEGYSQERINMAGGDVARFKNLLIEYKKDPEIMMQRIYLETMEKILPNIKNKVIIDEEARSVLPFLDLKREGRSS